MITLTPVPDRSQSNRRSLSLRRRKARDSGSWRMEASASGKQELMLRATLPRTTGQIMKAQMLRSLRSAFGARQEFSYAFLTPAAVAMCRSARLANRGAENVPAEFAGAEQDVACPVPAFMRCSFVRVSPKRTSAPRRSWLYYPGCFLLSLAGKLVPVSPTRLEGRRKEKERAAFPVDSPGVPVGRGCSVKAFAR